MSSRNSQIVIFKRWLFWLGLGAIIVACSILLVSRSLRGSYDETIGYATAPLRVVDVFDSPHLIDAPSPLASTRLPPPLLEESFETHGFGSWSANHLAIDTMEGVEVAACGESPRGLGSLLVDAEKRAYDRSSFSRHVAIRPKTTYRLRASIRALNLELEDPAGTGASVELSELGGESGGDEIVVHRHLPRERGTSPQWKDLEYTFRSSATARQLRIDLVAAIGRASGRACFDDITLQEIPPLTALMHRDPYQDTTRPLDPHPWVRRVSLNGADERPVILGLPFSSWGLPIAPDTDILLRTALSILPLGTASRFCFTIEWQEEGAFTRSDLTEHCLEAKAFSSPEWREVVVDLAPYTTRRGKLVFSTYGAGEGVGLWGNPRLVTRGRRGNDERPNLVLLIIDTLRADHLGFEGYDRPTSPHLDQLAQRSVHFPRAYATAPWTTPSLASLLTSRYPAQHHGGARIERQQRPMRQPGKALRGEASDKKLRSWEAKLLGDLYERAATLKFRHLDPTEITLGERLRSAGYATVGFHSNYNLSGLLGLSRGFDRYQLYWSSSPRGAYDGVALAQAWLQSRQVAKEEDPFFLFLHLQDPHMPYRLRKEQMDTFAADTKAQEADTLRPVGDWAVEFWNYQRLRQDGGGRDLDQAMAFYDSAIAHADAALGDFLATLPVNTALALVADHGEEFGDHGEFEHGHSLYDEVLRVPLLLKLPGDQRAGTSMQQPVSLVDVAPTFLQLARAEPLPVSEGRSLLDPTTPRRRPGLFAEAMLRGPDRTALIEGPYKYVYTHAEGYLDPYDTPFGPEPRLIAGRSPNVGKEELFDLLKDPDEQENLAVTQRAQTALFGARVKSYLEETVPGVHLRCRSTSRLDIDFSFDEQIGYLKPISLEEDDHVAIDPARRAVTLQLEDGEDDEDGLVLKFIEKAGEIHLESAPNGTEIYSGSSRQATEERTFYFGNVALAGPPAQRPSSEDPWCQIWEVASSSQTVHSNPLDESVAQGLRSLGYL